MTHERPVEAETLGSVLKAERQKREWSLRRAERESGISNAHLVQIENATISRPDHNVLFALAGVYGLRFDRLLRLAGYISEGATPRRSPYGAVAWKALGELSPDEQREVVDFIADLRRRRHEDKR
jgi:transcriptional regulator with XRE-family HTH domain